MSEIAGGAPYSVVIPACNEEAVIGRCLSAILNDAPEDAQPEIVVVCNGCSDATAERARAFPKVRVIELPVGSKPAALNAGLRAAQALPRFFVDADVAVSHATLAAVAAALAEPGVKAAAPRLRVNLNGCSWPVRRYYKVWQALPYVTDGLVGSGVYGLSAAGLEDLGEFPDVIADDGYVRTRFSSAERRNVAKDEMGRPAEFVVYPPRTARDLVRIESRRREGDAQVEAHHATAHTGRTTTARAMAEGLFRQYDPIDLAVYLVLKTAGREGMRRDRARGRNGTWRRDESSRGGLPR